MFLKTVKLKLSLLSLLLFTYCSEYQKALNDPDIPTKYAAAQKYYEEGKYQKANRLFAQVIPSYRGKPQAQRINFFYANTYFQTKQYNLSAYQFENFVKSYPRSDRVIEATFMVAKSHYMLSPVYSLDQEDTNIAIDKLQIFLDNHPNSEYSEEANTLIVELQVKLEKKSFEISKQYHTIRDYKAAINAFNNFISDFPGTPFKEEALFYKFLSHYELAINSVFSKKETRLNDAKESHNTLLRYFPETLFIKELNEKKENIEKELTLINQPITTSK